MMRLARQILVAVGLGTAVALVGWANLATGPQLSLTLLYFLPVLVATWILGGWAGGILAIAACGVSLGTDLMLHANTTLSLWNSTARSGVLLLGVALVGIAKRERNRVAAMNKKLDELLARESELARIDPVTGLMNRRGLIESIEREMARALRQGVSLGVVYLDLDNFKRVNDLYGHTEGDEVLRQVGEVIRQMTRAGDVAARVGGDEFVLLCWDATACGLEQTAGRVARAIGKLADCLPGTALGASVGYSCNGPLEHRCGADALQLADHAMYEAKARRKSDIAGVSGFSGVRPVEIANIGRSAPSKEDTEVGELVPKPKNRARDQLRG